MQRQGCGDLVSLSSKENISVPELGWAFAGKKLEFWIHRVQRFESYLSFMGCVILDKLFNCLYL